MAEWLRRGLQILPQSRKTATLYSKQQQNYPPVPDRRRAKVQTYFAAAAALLRRHFPTIAAMEPMKLALLPIAVIWLVLVVAALLGAVVRPDYPKWSVPPQADNPQQK